MSGMTETISLLSGWDNVLILTHKSPDGDAVGCAAALCRVLRAMGKTAWLAPMPDLTRAFTPYTAGLVAPEDFAPDHLAAVDASGQDRFHDSASAWRDRVELSIDHHESHNGFASLVNWVEPERAACGEMLYDLAVELGVMDREIAAALYVAVSTDTGCFVYGNTTPATHRIAAALMEEGIDTPALNKRHFRTKSLKRLKLESAIVASLELYQEDTIAVALLPRAMQDAIGVTEDDTDDITAFAGQLEGILHAVTIKEKEAGECRVSLRSDPNVLNASAVCARLGGGGHAAAAGCTFYGTVEQARDAILAAIAAEQRGD